MIFQVVSLVGKAAVGIGVSKIASTAIKSVTPVVANKALKVCMIVGEIFLSGAVASMAVAEYDRTIEAIAMTGKKIKEKIDEKKEIEIEA